MIRNVIILLTVLITFFGEVSAATADNQSTKNISEQLMVVSKAQATDDKAKIASELFTLGDLYFELGIFQKAVTAYGNSKDMYLDLRDSEGLARAYSAMGASFYKDGVLINSLESYLKAIQFYEGLKDDEGLAVAYLHIGTIYHDQKNDVKARLIFDRSLTHIEKAGNEKVQAAILLKIGITEMEAFEFQTGLDNLNKGYDIYEKLGDEPGRGDALDYLGTAYYKMGNTSEALSFYRKAQQVARANKDDVKEAKIDIQIGRLSLEMNRVDQAATDIKRGLSLAEKYKELHLMRDANELLAIVSDRKGKLKDSYNYYKVFTWLKDSIIKVENSESLSRLEIQFESERSQREIEQLNKDRALKQSEIDRQHAEVTAQTTQKIAFAIGFGLVLVVVVFVYRGYVQKKKVNDTLEEQNLIIEKKNKDITSSIKYAQRIQEATLPNKEQLQEYVPDSFIFFRPRDIVSGDFYWFVKQGDNLIISAVDCTGHGVPGAFMSLIGNEIIKDIVINRGVTDPATMLKELHTGIVSSLNKDVTDSITVDGMDIGYCCLNLKTGKLDFGGCGRPMVLIQDGTLVEVKGSRFPIGLITRKERKYETHSFQLSKGDSFYIFTDGFPDQFNESGEIKLTRDGFDEVLKSVEKLPRSGKEAYLEKYLTDWRGSYAQMDDICVIGIKF